MFGVGGDHIQWSVNRDKGSCDWSGDLGGSACYDVSDSVVFGRVQLHLLVAGVGSTMV